MADKDTSVSLRIDKWKEGLLDTSKRNRLLYFNPTPATTVELLEPDLLTLWNRLVIKEKTHSFYELEPDQNLFDDEESGDDEPVAPTRPLRPDEIRAEPMGPRLTRTLYQLRQKAKSSLEEQGVVTLFVAFGFLKWTAADEPNVDITSPLILAPVTLLRESARTAYKLKLWEEDVILNPALSFMLSSESKVTLPELPELDDIDLLAYLSQVQQAVAEYPTWRVREAAYLGLFSFHKIAMYNDLREHSQRAANHPLVRALAGDASQLPLPPADLPHGPALDNIPPHTTFQVVDADSSQQEAILAARHGASFVLQGPPGTGKSQTITNIIAECLAAGKKVLFVSEKMAALQVVYHRLTQNGLAEFCLQAHSHKANKREVVQELDRTLRAVQKATGTLDNTANELLRTRQQLNGYVAQLHTTQTLSALTPFEVYGRLAALDQALDLDFDYDRVLELTPSLMAELDAWQDELVRLYEVLLGYEEHPWRGVTKHDFSLQLQSQIRSHFTEFGTISNTLDDRLRALMEVIGVKRFASVTNARRLLELTSLLAQTPQPPAAWFQSQEIGQMLASAQAYKTQFEAQRRQRQALEATYHSTIFGLPQAALMRRLTIDHAPIIDRLLPPEAAIADTLVAQRSALPGHLERSARLLSDLAQSTAILSDALGLEKPISIADSVRLSGLADLVASNPRPQRAWFEPGQTSALLSMAEAAGVNQEKLATGRATLAAAYDVDKLLALDVKTLMQDFEGPYSSVLRVVNPSFYKAMKALQAVRNAPAKISFESVLPDLTLANDAQERTTWFETCKAQLEDKFGQHFKGLKTDWTATQQALATCSELVAQFADKPVPATIINILVAGSSGVEIVTAHNQIVRDTLAALQTELAALNKIFTLRNLPCTTLPVQHADMTILHHWFKEVGSGVADFLTAVDTVTATRLPNQAAPTVAQLAADLDQAQQVAACETRVQVESAHLQNTFGHLFSGLQTEWGAILHALDWTGQVMAWFGTNPLPQETLSLCCAPGADSPKVLSLAQEISALCGRLEQEIEFLRGLFPALTIGERPLEHVALPDLRAWVAMRLERLPELEDWLRFEQLRERGMTLGLASFWTALTRAKPTASAVKPAFYKRLWALWLDRIVRSTPVLSQFNGGSHELAIERFRALDEQLLKSSRSRLREVLWKEKPKVGWNPANGGQLAILQRQILLKRGHKPLRQLFHDIPHLLQALKPCILMSPLSVAQFLHPERIEFDVVVFDEASQICSEDAIGAIMRGKQLIVVGDRKQLPPTRFFATASAVEWDDEEAEEAVGDLYESILDECSTIGLPNKMLLWHYRSRNEQLIAFSNHYFYEDKLVTFPGPFAAQGAGSQPGVEFETAKGTYQRGKGRDARTNPVEAQRVAELVIEHFQQHRQETLGVITFNESQAAAIYGHVERLRGAHPDLDECFSETRDEPFFIKNLENVQGDERDVILFSVGYGPDQNGKVSMNFGPLNRAWGERRLNVAVTRARLRVKIVSSLQPEAIDPSRTSAEGPKLLRAYLQFAKLGAASLTRTATDVDLNGDANAMETIIAKTLEGHGLRVHRNIGYSELRIDLAVEDDTKAGCYLLGIECDGRSYQTIQTARDRDRLRYEVLSGLGWKILRVWSPDWVKHPEAQLKRIMDAVAEAKKVALLPPVTVGLSGSRNLAAPGLAAPGRVAPNLGTQAMADTPTDDDPQFSPVSTQHLPVAQPHVQGGTAINGFRLLNSDDASGSDSLDPGLAPSGGAPTLPDGAVYYEEFRVERKGAPEDFYALVQSRPLVVMNLLVNIVRHEGPIHLQEATRRVVNGWGMSKAGAKLVGHVQDIAQRSQARNFIVLRDDFLWPIEMTTPAVRVPAPGAAPRKIEEISLGEIGAAAGICVRESYGMERISLINATARLLGYKQTGINVRTRIEAALDAALGQGILKSQDGLIILKTG